jgi:hypothetical protein
MATVSVGIRRDSDDTFFNGIDFVKPSSGQQEGQLPAGPRITRPGDPPPTGPGVEYEYSSSTLKSKVTDGIYVVTAVARESTTSGQMESAVARSVVFVDTKRPPAPLITRPSTGSSVSVFGTIRGSASDNVGGGGIGRVQLTIKDPRGRYYDGTAFNSTSAVLLNATGAASWAYSSLGLNAADLIEGIYYITAISADRAGNKSTGASVSTVTVDKTDPTIDITTPEDGFVNSLKIIQGTAFDARSKVSKVRFSIREDGGTGVPARFYDGDDFSATSELLFDVNVVDNQFTFGTGPDAADLDEDRIYVIAAYAVDSAGNIGNIARVVVRVDKAAPISATFAGLTNQQIIQNFTTLAGRAIDNPNGSGIQSVTLAVQRSSDERFYNGNQFVATSEDAQGNPLAIELPTALSSPGRVETSWRYTGRLPSESQLTDSRYTLRATVMDRAGNRQRFVIQVIIDRTAPIAVTIDEPAVEVVDGREFSPAFNFDTIRRFVARGTARDNVGGSGIQRVDIGLVGPAGEATEEGTFDPRPFTVFRTPLKTTLTSLPGVPGAVRWSRTGKWPDPSDFREGGYTLIVDAYDRAGNVTRRVIIIQFDITFPSVRFTSPETNTSGRTFPAITGTASDNTNSNGTGFPSGIAEVQLFIQKGDLYWNGSRFVSTPTALKTRLTNPNSQFTDFRYEGSLPSAAGEYMLRAVAFDRAGNSSVGSGSDAFVFFTLIGTGSGGST